MMLSALGFFLCGLFLVSVPCGQRKSLIWFQFFLNLLRLTLCLIMWSIFENVPCAFENNVYFAFLWWKAVYISVKSISSTVLLSDTIYLLIFCLEDLSIFDSGELNFPTIIVLLSISFLKSSKIFFMYLGAPMLGAYVFTMFMSSWWILPLSIMKWPSGSLFSYFEVYFFWYEYCYSGFFSPVRLLGIFFPALHFQSV